MLGAITFGHEQMQVAIRAINELAEEAGKPRWDWQAPEMPAGLEDKGAESVGDGLEKAYELIDKMECHAGSDEVRERVVGALCDENDERAPEADVVIDIIGGM